MQSLVVIHMPFVHISNKVYEKSLRENAEENAAD
jgi:hypothetical protein